MSTVINGLLMPEFSVADIGRATSQGILAGTQQVQGQTSLLALQEAKEKQRAEQEYLLAIQNDPALRERLFGGSVLGSLGTAPAAPGGMPGQPSGAPTVVPGGQALSRFAEVSPQGGGPIPPNVMGQVTPTVTPPQGMPTLATLGPQGGMPGQPQGPMQAPRNPVLEMAARNPRVAMLMQQQMQGQEDLQMKRYGDRLEMGTKIAEAVGREAQTATDQASWDQARNNVAQFDPRAAAAMQAVFSPEAKAAFVKRAVGVKDNAQLQLETWKNQIEMQKAGLQGEPAAMVSELRTMGVNPLQATTEQRRQAQTNIQQREVEQKEKEGLASAQARTEGEKQARLDKTVSEAFGERTTKIYDAQTGQTVDARMKVKDYEALPAGRVKELSTNQTEQMENVNTSIPVIAQLQTHIDKLYGPGGVLERMSPEDREFLTTINPKSPSSVVQQFMQKYPELTAAQNFIDSNAGGLARALQGEKGAMAEGDVDRAKAMLPNLKTALNVWPPSKLGMQLPDTRAVALANMNNVVDLINHRVRTILGNEQFTHPKLHRYKTAEDVQREGGNPPGQPVIPPVQRPIPPVVGPNPNLTPLPPTFGPGDPSQQLKPVPPGQPSVLPGLPTVTPGPPAPPVVTPPSGPPTFGPGDPTQQLKPRPPAPPVTPPTTGKDYERLMRPPPPVKQSQAAPTPRSTPGRQSQAPTGTRLAGAPKYMEPRDVRQAMAQTGKSRAEVEAAARARGYTVYGSRLPLPEETAVG